MKIGDRIIWTLSVESPDSIREGVVTKYKPQTELVWVNGDHQPEDCIYVGYTWPASAKEQLHAILTERARLKKQFDDSMSLVYQLRNRITRGQE